MASAPNQRRAEWGIAAITSACNADMESLDLATAASDTIADILHAVYGVWDAAATVHGGHYAGNYASAYALLGRALDAWAGDREDEDL